MILEMLVETWFSCTEVGPIKIAYTSPLLFAMHTDTGLTDTTVGKVDGVENAAWAKVVAWNPVVEINSMATIEDGGPPMPDAYHVENLAALISNSIA